MTSPRPGLYEALLKRRAEQAAELPSASGAGSVVRIPRGFVYVVALLWGGTLIFAWALGRGTGRAEGFDEAVQAIQTESIPQVSPPPSSVGARGSSSSPVSPRGRVGTAVDPRQTGLNYLVVQSGSNQKALSELLDHLQSEGLAAFMTSATISSSRVLLSEGFSAPNSDPRAVALRNRLHRAGTTWKAAGGDSDLTDAYWEKFNGP
ncbi:MAG: hypothetical protein VX104_02495 [Planctomycetota bacterium]|jgi:hypothetical protein|nr:hypothetical protein [Planctomycetota bacterium]